MVTPFILFRAFLLWKKGFGSPFIGNGALSLTVVGRGEFGGPSLYGGVSCPVKALKKGVGGVLPLSLGSIPFPPES